MSNPTLYTFHLSVWSAAADLARIELGLVDKVDAKPVNVLEAETLSPDFLKINSAGTVPTLMADGKLYGDTTSTIDAMIDLSGAKIPRRTGLTQAVHDDSRDPNFLLRSARNEADVAKKAAGKDSIATRLAKIKEYASQPASAPFQALFDARITAFSIMLSVFDGSASATTKKAFFAASQDKYAAARSFILDTLPSSIESDGPFVAGALPGEDDFHVAAWLVRIARSAGAGKESEGIAALEGWFEAPVPEKVKALWGAWVGRESFKTVYPDGALH